MLAGLAEVLCPADRARVSLRPGPGDSCTWSGDSRNTLTTAPMNQEEGAAAGGLPQSCRGRVGSLRTARPPHAAPLQKSSTAQRRVATSTGQALAPSVREPLCLLSPSLPRLGGQRQQGTTPSPVPSACLPGGSLPRVNGKEERHLLFWKCRLASLSPWLCPVQWLLQRPRQPYPRPCPTHLRGPKHKAGAQPEAQPLPSSSFHPSKAGILGRCRKAHARQGHSHTMRGGFSKVCFIEMWEKKKEKKQFHPYIQPGSRPSLLPSSSKPSLTVPVYNPFLFSVHSAALLNCPINKRVRRGRWPGRGGPGAWEHKGCSPRAPVAVLGLPTISYLAHSMLQRGTKGRRLPSPAGVTQPEPLVCSVSSAHRSQGWGKAFELRAHLGLQLSFALLPQARSPLLLCSGEKGGLREAPSSFPCLLTAKL